MIGSLKKGRSALGLWHCIRYLAFTGLLSFLLGRLLPKGLFHADRFPYRPRAFERQGQIYKKIGVHRWQNRLPDMSRLFPRLMPAKSVTTLYRAGLERMLQETCVAEFIHALLMLTGLHCLRLWPGLGGGCMAAANALLFNLPFVIIQRYNRPRLLRLRKKKEESRA